MLHFLLNLSLLLSLTTINIFESGGEYTKYEQLLLASISNAIEKAGIDVKDKKTVLIISSTKGNISLLETEAL